MREKAKPDRPVVVHSVSPWLSQTMTWVYHQAVNTSQYSTVVYTDRLANLAQFPHRYLYSKETVNQSFLARILRKIGAMSRYPVFDQVVTDHKPKILHSHFGDGGWANLDLVRKYGLRHVVTFYGYDVNMLPFQDPVWKNRYKKLFREADLFLCEGPHMAKCVVALGCPPEKVKIQRLGVDLQKISFVPRAVESGGDINILIAGTFREKKGIPYALRAIGILMGKYSFKVTLVGDVTGQEREAAERKKIMDVIEQYKMQSIVSMKGFLPYETLLQEAYKHHVFLSPSLTASDGDTEGGSPVTITELAASGMPVVSTWHCDIPEVVHDGESGFLASEGDIESLVEALETCVASSRQWGKIGRAAREHIENTFDMQQLVGTLEEYYGSIVR